MRRPEVGPAPALALVGYLALALALTARLWLDPGQRQPPNPPDVALFTWFLTWDAHPSLGLHASQLNAPDGVNVMAQTGVLLPGLLLAPLTRAAGAQVTYTLLLTLGPALSAWSAYLVLRRLGGLIGGGTGRSTGCGTGSAGPLLGGLLYGFGPAMVAEAYGGHLQFTLAVLPPVLLLLATEAMQGSRPPLRTGALIGLLAGAQLLIGAELLLMTALAGMGIVMAVRPPWRRMARLLAGAIPAGLAIAGWPLVVLFLGRGATRGNIQQTGHFQEDLAGLVVPTRLMLFHAGSAFTDRFPTGVQERTSYLGVLLLGLVGVAAVRRWSDRRVRLAVVLAAAFTVLSLGGELRVAGHRTGVALPWALVERAPVIGNMLPSRLPLLVGLAAAVILAVGGGAAGQAWGRWGLAACGLALLPLVPAPMAAEAVTPTPRYFADRPSGTLLVLPFPTPTRIEAMRWQAAAGLSFAMPGGFFVGPGPGGQARFGAVPTPTSTLLAEVAAGRTVRVGAAERAAFRRDVARWGVTEVVLGPSAHRHLLRATVTALVGQGAQSNRGVDVWPLPSLR